MRVAAVRGRHLQPTTGPWRGPDWNHAEGFQRPPNTFSRSTTT
jgi:hypothetical protein